MDERFAAAGIEGAYDLRVPQINRSTPSAAAINEAIRTRFGNAALMMLSDAEFRPNELIGTQTMKTEYAVYGSNLSIKITWNFAPCYGTDGEIWAVNYDFANDVAVPIETLAERRGLDWRQLRSAASAFAGEQLRAQGLPWDADGAPLEISGYFTKENGEIELLLGCYTGSDENGHWYHPLWMPIPAFAGLEARARDEQNIPPMTAENIAHYYKYVRELSYCGFFARNFEVRDGAFVTGEEDMGTVLMFLFEDVSDPYALERYRTNDYTFEFPQEVVELFLQARFELTTEQLRAYLAQYYVPEKWLYHYEQGRGGAPVYLAVDKAERDGNLLMLHWRWYTVESAGVSRFEGVTEIREEPGGAFKYLSNKYKDGSAG